MVFVFKFERLFPFPLARDTPAYPRGLLKPLLVCLHVDVVMVYEATAFSLWRWAFYSPTSPPIFRIFSHASKTTMSPPAVRTPEFVHIPRVLFLPLDHWGSNCPRFLPFPPLRRMVHKAMVRVDKKKSFSLRPWIF